MKKLIFAALIFAGFTASAQSTSPRWSTASNGDNTGRVFTNKKVSKSDAAGNDSLTITPSASYYYVTATITDSVSYTIAVSQAYFGDKLTIIASGTSKLIKFYGSNVLSKGNATTSSNGRAVINFIFDGSKWVESYRTVQ